MRLSSVLIPFAAFVAAAFLSIVAAVLSADMIEDASQRGVQSELARDGMTWADVHAEGLQVFLTGIAPTEAERFKAISAAGRVVDAARVIDNMQIEATAGIAPPRFSVEILRNEAGIQLIGLIPEASDRDRLLRELGRLDGDPEVTDFLETAAYDMPDGWQTALNYALSALEELPRSKISVETGRVAITGMSDSPEERREIEQTLRRMAPPTLELVLDISAPRPVITPFTLRFIADAGGARFDACSADSDEARDRILAAAQTAGLQTDATCTIGLGVPTPRWADAVEIALDGIDRLGGGSVTFSDADITLVALMGTDPDQFDRVVGELETSLPEVFALHSTLPTPVEEDSEAPEFTATLSPEGLLQMRGRLPNELTRTMTESYAASRFGSGGIHMAARLDETLPATWSLRVMAGLDALSHVNNGVLTVTGESVSVTGFTGDARANDDISRLLADKLDKTDHFAIDVTYLEELDPIAQLPTPEECVGKVKSVLDAQQVTFEPGSGTLDAEAEPVLDSIAEILRACEAISLKLEIQGHTDSQGREEMNQALSQTRAQSVLNALHDRRILTSGFTAVGYGETTPIADNDTEEGREANRRIEFVLIRPAEDTETEAAAAETPEETAPEDAAQEDQESADSAPQETDQDDQN
ncbi:OmpA family protein [Shimia sp. FJ5]|uniref:OmpA family protein n=1 Tax=Shimia sp. FJ5 TaxID=3079054 RepID=UPI00261F1A0C|nr:OmpA family protein [Shimia sp. FJ5]MDV4144994.1 OmpA family protein [Shimia sp. FJ5]